MSEGLYLIWSHEHGLWWGEAAFGYVETVREAGRYTKDQAAEITLDHVPAGEEVAVPQEHAMTHDRGAVWGIPDELKNGHCVRDL